MNRFFSQTVAGFECLGGTTRAKHPLGTPIGVLPPSQIRRCLFEYESHRELTQIDETNTPESLVVAYL